MQFSEILRSVSHAGSTGEQSVITVSEDWLQGRATFGGLVAAVGNEVMRRLVDHERPLRSLQTTFIGPAGPGTWQARARVLRVGRAVTLAQCEILYDGQVAALQTGVYGMDRESSVIVKPTPTDPPRHVDEIKEVRFFEETSPAFAQHFALKFAMAAKPFSGEHSPTKVFIRHRDPEPLTESHIVALVDCIPSPSLSMFKAPAPASTLVWGLEFFEHGLLAFGPDAWWRIDTDIDAASGGYVNQTGLLYDPNGRPVALSRQVVAVFG